MKIYIVNCAWCEGEGHFHYTTSLAKAKKYERDWIAEDSMNFAHIQCVTFKPTLKDIVRMLNSKARQHSS